MAAVSELRREQGDAIDFVVVPAAETAQRKDEIERFQFGGRRHGLVAFDASGAPVVIFAGHNFGRAEIEMAVSQVAGK
ncbi:MAG: hypothetical protein HOP15_07435 [Planctomycetes bacterium]|nr:hypothetical protein [Planctomycetota bacterium]